ncbi:MAG: 30S ribosomal protein S9 [Candidatus Micrarchaeota archaeon]|nr:30S ribosomal protein S9 [Candidatus Micrarchaeota archaeon]
MAVAKRKKKQKKETVPAVFRGKRKKSIARASIKPGKGIVRINSVNLNAIDNKYVQAIISEPLRLAPEIASKVDISVNVFGGGIMGQAQACRVAIARALCGFSGDDSLKARMLAHDRFLLAEDSRRIEPKKYKGPKARARFQKSYR